LKTFQVNITLNIGKLVWSSTKGTLPSSSELVAKIYSSAH